LALAAASASATRKTEVCESLVGGIGWKARPLLRIRYGYDRRFAVAKDDVGNRRRCKYQAGKPRSQRVEPPSLKLRRARRQRLPPWLFCGMVSLSYRSPKTEVRKSKIHGRGLFATADIGKNEIVAIKGGHIVDGKTLREKITPLLGPVEIQIDDDLFIAPVTEGERDLSMLYLNHSCDPNLGMRGEITFVAMRDIHFGEELTHDWAMTDDDDYSIECNCGAVNCRKTLTGKDWQRPDLQQRYGNYFSAYLARKIAALFIPSEVENGAAGGSRDMEGKARG